MPFDNTGIITAKQPEPDAREAALRHIKALERLLKLSETATDQEQHTFNSCLWYRARWDTELWALGLKNTTTHVSHGANVSRIFGADANGLWDCSGIKAKQARILYLIEQNQRAMETA